MGTVCRFCDIDHEPDPNSQACQDYRSGNKFVVANNSTQAVFPAEYGAYGIDGYVEAQWRPSNGSSQNGVDSGQLHFEYGDGASQ